MPDKERDWDLNVVSTDPSDPEGLDGKTYGMISGGRKIQVGDTLPEGVVEGFVDRGVRILPDTGPEYIRRMGDHRMTPRARMKDDAAETALQKAARKNTIDLDELPSSTHWGDSKQLEDFIRPSNPNMWMDIDPPTEEELDDREEEDRHRAALRETIYPPLSKEEEMEYPEDLRHPAYRDAEPGHDEQEDEREYDEQEDTGDVDYIPHEGY